MASPVALPEKPENLSPEVEVGPQATEALIETPLAFVALTPCRVADTRGNGFSSQYGPPKITPAGRTITIVNNCGIPVTAQAVSFNFSAVNVPGAGFLVAYPAGAAFPASATMTYNQNTPNLSNAAVVPLGTAGAITVVAGVVSIDLVIDVNGYYAPQTVVNTVNGLSGLVTLAAGSNVTITPSGQTLTVSTTSSPATSANTPNTIVLRDASGGFAAGTVALSGNLSLPASTSSAGALVQLAGPIFHTFGSNNVFAGVNAGNFSMTGTFDTGLGSAALSANTTGANNTAVGSLALLHNTTGSINAAGGTSALSANTTGSANSAFGRSALLNNTTGSNNTAVGTTAMIGNTTGSGNIAIGQSAGGSLTTGNNNIVIGNSGVAAEAGTIRIGSASQTRAFLAGVRGVTTGVANGLGVLIDGNGQLGTISSTASVKREIHDVGDASSALLALRPVSFFYRNDAENITQYGMIAEEVARVMPELVQYSAGRPETVRYHFLAPLLVNEIQKQQRRIDEQEDVIRRLLERLDALENARANDRNARASEASR